MLKQRKNKTFNYKPRFSKKNSPKEGLDDGFKENSFANKWQQERESNLVKGKRRVSLPILILILVLLLICMYMLESKFM